MPANGIFSNRVMNIMSCIALTGQVTKTKTKKAEYFEGATIVYMSKNVLSFMIADKKAEINILFSCYFNKTILVGSQISVNFFHDIFTLTLFPQYLPYT